MYDASGGLALTEPERQQREQAEAALERLRAKLRKMGIEP